MDRNGGCTATWRCREPAGFRPPIGLQHLGRPMAIGRVKFHFRAARMSARLQDGNFNIIYLAGLGIDVRHDYGNFG